MFVDEEDIVLEARIQMGLQSKLDDNRIVVTIYVCVDAIESLEKLTDQDWEGLWKWYT